jgi:3',5'-cyclic AMP phosphodiesterase CpdA
MRFAAIADVHGNHLALEAVIADIRAQNIDEIVNPGDMASGPLDARLDAAHLDWLRAVRPSCVFRDQVFLCHATPDSDEVYWLETVLADGAVRMSSLEEIEKAAAGTRSG